MKCRFDGTELKEIFVDLIGTPPSNAYLTEEELNFPENYYPLKLFVNESNWLVQIDEYKSAQEIFGEEYVYFSSYSTSWLKHAENYVDMIVERLNLDKNSMVAEIAANDGYLLQYFLKYEIPCYGIEPSTGPSKVAKEKGIDIVEEYFGVEQANFLSENRKADLILGNNVFAHVPDINDFVGGMKILLNLDGVITLEFPHLMELVDNNQFDTIYHEHFYYFSLTAVNKVMNKHQLEVFDVEQISTHGGSLRVFIQHINGSRKVEDNVANLLNNEEIKGMKALTYYTGFQEKVNKIKNESMMFLLKEKNAGKSIIGYGAAAKGNTYFNYCGIKQDLIDYVVDASPFKQNMYLPGSHIPIVSEDMIMETKPDYVLILPWNIKDEISNQLSYIRDWGGKFIVAIPSIEVF